MEFINYALWSPVIFLPLPNQVLHSILHISGLQILSIALGISLFLRVEEDLNRPDRNATSLFIVLVWAIQLEVGFIKKKTTWGNKEVPQTLYHCSLRICENRFNPFDYVPLATLRFKMLDYRPSHSLFCKKFCKVTLLWCHEISNGVKQIKFILADKGNTGTRFGAPVYYLK